MTLKLSIIPCISSHFRFQWEKSQNAYVLLYPEGMIILNDSAGEILKYCDGKNSIDSIINKVQHAFLNVEIAEDIMAFLEESYAKGWLS